MDKKIFRKGSFRQLTNQKIVIVSYELDYISSLIFLRYFPTYFLAGKSNITGK